MRLVVGRKARPLFDEFVPDGLFAVEAVLLLLGDIGVVERNAALLRDTLADLFDVELRNAVADRQQQMCAKHQSGRKNHGRAPSIRFPTIARSGGMKPVRDRTPVVPRRPPPPCSPKTRTPPGSNQAGGARCHYCSYVVARMSPRGFSGGSPVPQRQYWDL